ncbi:apolipoprotein A-I-like [Hyperolius riggenbachi]|uniref:apolipoprotein A-I-like n=1 Tax=Hyperolius riggenbachi TaxID=752182 RepID=UPI0035A2B146
MRGLFVALALLFLTGTQARFPWQHEEPQTPLHHAQELIESGLHKIREIGKEVVEQAESSDIAKTLDLKISDKYDAVSSNALAIKKQLHPYLLKLKEEIGAELQKDIPIFREKIQPYVETFQMNWAGQVKAFRENAAPVVDNLKKQTKDNLESFYKNLQPQIEELKKRLHSEVESLRANIAPYKEELRQKLVEKFDEVKANAGPRAEEYKAQVAQNLENLRQRLAPVVENLKEQLLPKLEEGKAKLAEAWEALRARVAAYRAQA